MPCCKSVRPLGSVGRFQRSNEAQVIDDYPNGGRQWWSRWSGADNGGLRRLGPPTVVSDIRTPGPPVVVSVIWGRQWWSQMSKAANGGLGHSFTGAASGGLGVLGPLTVVSEVRGRQRWSRTFVHRGR